MNYEFYAEIEDKIDVLNYIINELELKIFDSYSKYDESIIEYKSVEEIINHNDLKNGTEYATSFRLWHPIFSPKVLVEKINLNPEKCNGHTFRYAARGWGMINLHFGGLKKNRLHRSSIGHFNEKGALRIETSNHINGKVTDWNWKDISKISRKLKYQIDKKMTVEKISSYGVLAAAYKLKENGSELAYGIVNLRDML
ncbi:hypothetical protein JBL43_14985 [Aureibaculum sp. A20]|uniref:Uncharacterized protein n=1 Tax=Aureibaculum flavum TaxID=2795986 RepID=A0ABS0WUC3_9FLAO|nr:hypothetical protein [Aureibaculum flavum]MBJ2175555.1 hypothetical protein [Aureibaculum flavum]